MPADPTPEEEVRRLERHYSVNPEGLVFARLADAYRRCGRLERSLELLRDGLDRHPDYATGHLIHGRVLREAGRPEEAVDAYRRVLELDAENLVALRCLAQLAADRGDSGEARRWADRLHRADPFATFSPEGMEEGRADAPDAGPVGSPSPGEGSVAGERPAAAGDESPEPRRGAGSERGDADGTTASPRPVGSGDGSIPGEEGLASEIAAMADEQWWSGAAESYEDDGDEDPDVATETMARLYAEQGLYDEAAEVYRRLADRRPDEPELRRRMEEMRRRAAGDEPADGTPGTDEPREPEGRGAPDEAERHATEEEDAPETGEDDPPPRGEVSAREHFRALLRGRARAGDPGPVSTPDADASDSLAEAVEERSA